jgi:Rod binding domain-containing protein
MLELTAPEAPKEFGGGFAEEQFNQMKNEFLADEMAKKRTFGIGNHVYDQLLRKQLGE